MTITIKDEKQSKLKEFMRSEGVKQIREQFARYLVLLKEEFSQGLILPTDKVVTPANNAAKSANGAAKETPAPVAKSQPTTTSPTSPTDETATVGAKMETKKLTMTEEFKCRARELYQVFTDINVGGETSLFLYFLFTVKRLVNILNMKRRPL